MHRVPNYFKFVDKSILRKVHPGTLWNPNWLFLHDSVLLFGIRFVIVGSKKVAVLDGNNDVKALTRQPLFEISGAASEV